MAGTSANGDLRDRTIYETLCKPLARRERVDSNCQMRVLLETTCAPLSTGFGCGSNDWFSHKCAISQVRDHGVALHGVEGVKDQLFFHCMKIYHNVHIKIYVKNDTPFVFLQFMRCKPLIQFNIVDRDPPSCFVGYFGRIADIKL